MFIIGTASNRPAYFTGGGTTQDINVHATLGGSLGQGHVCNANGILAGWEQDGGEAGFHLFWLNTATDEIRDLGENRTAYAMNASGNMAVDELIGTHKTYLYDATLDSLTDCGLLEGGGQSTPVTLNDSNVIAINSTISGTSRACRWTSGGGLVNITPAAAGTRTSQCVAINANGDITGTYLDALFVTKTFINTGGASTDIGDLGGEVVPEDINDSGVVVGTIENGANFTAFMWTSGGGIVEIPKLGGTTDGDARSVNNDGDIVGVMDSTPYLYRGGVTTAIADLIVGITGATGWTTIFTADFVNNGDDIVGFGIYNGEFKGYRLHLPTV